LKIFKRKTLGKIKPGLVILILIVLIAVSTITGVLLRRYIFDGKEPFILLESVSIDGGNNGLDGSIGIVYDPINNILYAAGFVSTSSQGTDIWLAKFTDNLIQIKNITLNGSTNGDDMGYTLVLDEEGFLYVIGYITNDYGRSIWVAKYDSELSQKNELTIDGQMTSDIDEGYGILYDGSTYIYIAGTITTTTGHDIFIGKLDKSLDIVDYFVLNGPSNNTDKARFLALDDSGYLYVSGSINNFGTNYDIWLGKLDTDLNLIANQSVAGPTTGEDKGYGLLIDNFGSIYIVGTMTEVGEGYNLWLAKYTNDLTLLKNVTYDGPVNGEDVAYTMILAEDGYFYLAGVYTESIGGSNIFLARFTTQLELKTYQTVKGYNDEYDTGYGIIKGIGKTIYLSGCITDENEGGNIWFAHYEIK